QFPGNYNYRCRKEYITSKNFGNFAAIHALPTGRGADETPWGDIVTHFPDILGSPYAFNFHEQWSAPREPSPGHTVIVGAQDSGKSTLAAFLAGQAIRTGARVFVFDKDNALEMAVRAYGGKYTNLHAGEPTGLNPFATEVDKEGVNWLAGWLEALVFGDAQMSEDQSKRLYEILNDNASAPKGLQNFSGFTPEFVSLDDDGLMLSRLKQWCKDGQFAWAFEAKNGKSFTLDDRVMGFDFTELLDKPRFRTPILAYILRLIERSIKDREPTLIIIDEAWKMLDDPYFVKILKEWMVTMRKKNVAVIMMSQIVSHFSKSGIAASISENMNTKIIFPNARAEADGYKFFGFNEKQCEIATTATGGMRLAMIESGSDRTMLNVDLSALGSYVTVLGGGKAGAQKYGKNWRKKEHFWKDTS
ncbi:MAG: type IV secretion system protein B4, partial [Rhizobiaceae bacterium]